jgi:hypothetical protein
MGVMGLVESAGLYLISNQLEAWWQQEECCGVEM